MIVLWVILRIWGAFSLIYVWENGGRLVSESAGWTAIYTFVVLASFVFGGLVLLTADRVFPWFFRMPTQDNRSLINRRR